MAEGERDSGERDALVGDMVVELGRSLLVSGYNVVDARHEMRQTATNHGVVNPELGVFPTLVLYAEAEHPVARALVVSPNQLRFDKVMQVHETAVQSQLPGSDPVKVLASLREQAKFTRRARTGMIGYAIASCGFSLILRASWSSALATLGLAACVAVLLRLLHAPRQQSLAPLVGAYLASLAASLIASRADLDMSPLLIALACVALLIPSTGIVTATEELAGGEMVSGSSRLVFSVVQIILLAIAIYAGYRTAGVGDRLPTGVTGTNSAWAAALGVVIFTFGVALFTMTPIRVIGWVYLVVAVTYATQQLTGTWFGSELGVGIAAAIGLAFALIIQRLRIGAGVPAIITFTPAFWVLIPGAFALGTLVEMLSGAPASANTTTTIVLSMTAIVMGCLVGSMVGNLVPTRVPRHLVA